LARVEIDHTRTHLIDVLRNNEKKGIVSQKSEKLGTHR
jgi:hypothetical protein